MLLSELHFLMSKLGVKCEAMELPKATMLCGIRYQHHPVDPVRVNQPSPRERTHCTKRNLKRMAYITARSRSQRTANTKLKNSSATMSKLTKYSSTFTPVPITDIKYSKHLDSHLKPYRCRYPDCAPLKFSSTACLLRHEREAHGLHGHGDKPYPCHFPDCDRSAPGQGFPRQWNLRDHMRRVHNYSPSPSNEYPSPPSSDSSGEADIPCPRKRSPASALDTGTKKPRGGNSSKFAKGDMPSGYADSEREQHMKLKAFIDRTYKDLDSRDTEAVERYHAHHAQLDSLYESMRRKELRRGVY